MAVPANAPIVARRNAPLGFEWAAFTADGLPVDFTGATVAMQVRLYGAQAGDALIDLSEVAGGMAEGLTAADGVVAVVIHEATLLQLPRGRPGASVVFRYDLIVALAGGLAEVWAEGTFTVKPGVTDRLFMLIAGAGNILVAGAKYLVAR